MLGEVLGVERRRRWSDDEKLEILSEVGFGGATVTQVAQRHELTRSQIYGWRRDLKKKGLWSPDRGAVFLPMDFGAIPDPASAPVPPRSTFTCITSTTPLTLRAFDWLIRYLPDSTRGDVDARQVGRGQLERLRAHVPGELGHPELQRPLRRDVDRGEARADSAHAPVAHRDAAPPVSVTAARASRIVRLHPRSRSQTP